MAFITLQHRHAAAAVWTAAGTTVLAAGEIGVESDTLKFKIGDGSTIWTSLGYQATNYTDEMAQDAVGGIMTDTNSIDMTYDDGNNQIKADVKITASPGDVTLSIQSDGLKGVINALDCGGAT